MIRCAACNVALGLDSVRSCRACGARIDAVVEPAADVPALPLHVQTMVLDLPGTRSAQPAAVAGEPLKTGRVLAKRYRISRALKSGGMGAVYLATDEHQGNMPVAIKEMLDRFTNDDEREEGEVWFHREAMTLAALQHQNIPQIFDYFIEGGRYYLALEYVDGENFEDRLAREGSPGLHEQLVLNVGAQLCEVLDYLHKQRPPIIFRDLKPANIMITQRGRLLLVDFGIARTFSALRGVSLVGTPGYAPIEQYQGLSDEQSDLYSLGATLHHLLTGCDPRTQPPFSFKPARLLAPSVTEATEGLLQGVLQKEPGDRRPRIEAFGRQLRRVDADLRQGLVPTVMGSAAYFVPGGPMPPTQMSVPITDLNFGTRTKGERHTMNLPISNEGKAELRVVIRASVPWLHPPDGQLRVPSGTLVKVPIYLDAMQLPVGTHAGRLELDGNGGVTNVPVDVSVGYWWFNGAGVLMIAGVAGAIVLAIAVHLLLSF